MSGSAVVDQDAITAAFDALDAAVDKVAALNFAAGTAWDRLVLLERCARVPRCRYQSGMNPLLRIRKSAS